MQSFIVYCPSVTAAQKGQRLLEARGIPSRLYRGSLHGCTYGLEIPEGRREAALGLLEEGGVVYAIAP